MSGFGRTMGLLIAIGTLLGMAIVLPAVAPVAQASPAPFSGGTTQQWAYGAEKWANASVTMPNGSYNLHAFFGWQVVLSATNTTSTTVAVEAQRTVAASLFASYCAPNCASPTITGNLSFRAYEQDTGFANFTTAATVYENGTAMPALGILNASAESRGAVNESFAVTFPHNGSTYSATASVSATGGAHASVAFTPALGLVPWNVAPNVTWNSSAAYAASGQWAFHWAASRTTLLGSTATAGGSPSGSVNTTGSVDLAGTDLGTVTLNNGATVPVIVLALSGPFDDAEGIILVPHDFDLFGGGVHPWDGHALGAATFATSRVDLFVDAGHRHVQVVAGASAYARADSSLGPIGGVSPAVQPLAAPAPNSVQAQPESVPQAQQSSNCLVNVCGTGAASHAPASLAGSVLVIGLLIGLIVGTVGAIEWRQWSRRPSAHPPTPGYGPIPPTGAVDPPVERPGVSASLPPPPPPTA